MKISAVFSRRWQSFHLPFTCLLALLQRTPVVRLATVSEEFVLRSPIGTALKSAAALLGTLGAVHSLAGATEFVISPSSSVSGTVGKPISPVAFTIIGSPTPPNAFSVVGLPPGLTVSDGGAPVISGTPTRAGQYTVQASGTDGTYSLGATISFDISEGDAAVPSFSTQPTTQTVSVGATVQFTVIASGSPAPTFQWRKNGAAISGATTTTLSLPNVQLSDAGSYTCVATNSAGSATSNAATLTVNAATSATAPVFTTQPASKTIATGSAVVFSATATGSPAPTFQWRKNGSDLPGSTGPTLVLTGTTVASAGSYTCVATNSAGSVTSSAATLTVSATTDFGRIINLSLLTGLTRSEGLFTVGTVIGGSGTSGNKPVIIRAGGPALNAYGIVDVLPDPKLDLFSSGTVIASNDNWGGGTALVDAFAGVGAFSFAPNSSDAALSRSLSPGSYSIQVKDSGGASGTVIAELYDATPASSFTPTTPRLVNVSVLKQIDAGTILTVGFVIGGSTAKTVLVRAAGPTLSASYGVGNAMPDPKLDLFSGQTIIASNDNWGGDAQLAAGAKSVGAFDFSSATSKDAMLLITLVPGAYSVQAGGVSGSSGMALIEVYEVP